MFSQKSDFKWIIRNNKGLRFRKPYGFKLIPSLGKTTLKNQTGQLGHFHCKSVRQNIRIHIPEIIETPFF
jgi:hypothetical protein